MPADKKMIYGILVIVTLLFTGMVFSMLLSDILIRFYYFIHPVKIGSQFDYLACNSDEDCAIVYIPINGCCGKCDVYPVNVNGLDIQEEWRKKNCNEEKMRLCPLLRCPWPAKKSVCLNGKCVLKEISAAPQEEIFSVSCPQNCSSETKTTILSTAQKTLEVFQKEFPWMAEPALKTSYAIEVNLSDTIAGGRSYVDYEIRIVKLVTINTPTIAHEISHLLTAEYFGIEKTHPPLSENVFPKGPAWLQEGLAMYLEYKVDNSRNAKNIGLLKNASKFLDITNPESSGDTNLWYAQAWSVLEYIIQKGGKEHFELLCECVKAKMLPVMGGVLWNECFDGIYKDITPSWDAFYQEWMEYAKQNY